MAVEPVPEAVAGVGLPRVNGISVYEEHIRAFGAFRDRVDRRGGEGRQLDTSYDLREFVAEHLLNVDLILNVALELRVDDRRGCGLRFGHAAIGSSPLRVVKTPAVHRPIASASSQGTALPS